MVSMEVKGTKMPLKTHYKTLALQIHRAITQAHQYTWVCVMSISALWPTYMLFAGARALVNNIYVGRRVCIDITHTRTSWCPYLVPSCTCTTEVTHSIFQSILVPFASKDIMLGGVPGYQHSVSRHRLVGVHIESHMKHTICTLCTPTATTNNGKSSSWSIQPGTSSLKSLRRCAGLQQARIRQGSHLQNTCQESHPTAGGP